MDLIDVDSHKWAQYGAASFFGAAWLYRREARHLAAFERRIAREFGRVLLVTRRELEYFPGGNSSGHLEAMPNGVDLEYFSSGGVAPVATAGPTIVFTGVMNYRPNVEGVLWFADRIFPRVQAAVPRARLYVVGSSPTRSVRRLDMRPGITVTGQVEDVRPYLSAASVCVAPLRIARGLQNKILEAMAMGRAVVVTPEAFEGIDAVPGRDLIVAEDESQFAAAVINVLQSERVRADIGASARVCVELNYKWERNLRLLDELFPETGWTRDRDEQGDRAVGREAELVSRAPMPPAG
jgi:sugar transferase (PEP-CTERM/EpsH1 system associated)